MAVPIKEIYIDLSPVLERTGLNLNKLSELTKIHPTVLYKLQWSREEGENKRATLDVLEKICTITQCHLDQFMFIEGESPPMTYLPNLDPKSEKIEITCNLRYLLAKEGMSLRQLSQRIDETYNNLWKLANQEVKRLSFRTIGKILAFFDCGISDLFRLDIRDGTVLKETTSPYGQLEYSIFINLSAVLKKKNTSMLKVSQGSGVPYSLIRRMKNNEAVQVDIESLEKICNYLQVPPDEIIKYRRKSPGNSQTQPPRE
ncbi:helix-turn-helix domain-containing protein [Bacillus piscicola]|uniref:helix-turn-helix domain-containing protein n=1 Tax=Bacillus piscicola TaxID=1632684 RepID=UPI001F092671|nr:helix-turn-helix transcriptional regulator [Bacillus piscicola]